MLHLDRILDLLRHLRDPGSSDRLLADNDAVISSNQPYKLQIHYIAWQEYSSIALGKLARVSSAHDLARRIVTVLPARLPRRPEIRKQLQHRRRATFHILHPLHRMEMFQYIRLSFLRPICVRRPQHCKRPAEDACFDVGTRLLDEFEQHPSIVDARVGRRLFLFSQAGKALRKLWR